MDLMDMVKGAVSKQIMGKIGGMLGTDEKKTSSVFETAAGSILGGLIKKSSTPDGARDVFDMTSKQDDSVLDKLGDILGGGQAGEDFQKTGGGILDGVFGKSNQSGMLGALAKALGLDEKMVRLRAAAGRIDKEFLLIKNFGERLIDSRVMVLLGLQFDTWRWRGRRFGCVAEGWSSVYSGVDRCVLPERCARSRGRNRCSMDRELLNQERIAEAE